MKIFIISLFILLTFFIHSEFPCQKIGDFNVANPAFLTFVNGHLYVSTFSIMSSKLYMVPNFSKFLLGKETFKNITVALMPNFEGNLKWSNELDYSEEKDCLFVNDGFLVPFKGDGNLFCIPNIKASGDDWRKILNEKPVDMIPASNKRKDFFYHRTMVVDLDGDGKGEVITARAKKTMFSSVETEMLIFKSNGLELNNLELKANFSGPDIFFDIAKVPNRKAPIIVAAQFFSNKVIFFQKNFGNFVKKT